MTPTNVIIEVEPLCESWGPGGGSTAYGWYARGHVEPEAFIAAIFDDHRINEAFLADYEPPAVEHVYYEWVRFIPWGQGERGGYFTHAVPHSRGATEQTCAEYQRRARPS